MKSAIHIITLKKGLLLTVIAFLFISICYSQNRQTLFIRQMLREIKDAQITDSGFYYPGTFPCERVYGKSKKVFQDNNVFFTGLVAFTLQRLQPKIQDSVSLHLIAEIRSKALQSFPHFLDRNAKPVYNFWPTKPPVLFPGAKVIHFLRPNSPLSDDLDDTVILYLAMDSCDSAKYRLVLSFMDSTANTVQKTIRNTHQKYKHIPAYSTWFGSKMPKDFDFCVLTNVLYFLHYYHLPIGVHALATIDLLDQMLFDREYIKHPAYISPHYGRTPILIYHYARLVNAFPIAKLLAHREEVISAANAQLEKSSSPMDQVLLTTALQWLGAKQDYSTPNYDSLPAAAQDRDFAFFVAGIYSYFDNPFKSMGAAVLKKYHFRCEAYNKVLLLENMLANKKAATN